MNRLLFVLGSLLVGLSSAGAAGFFDTEPPPRYDYDPEGQITRRDGERVVWSTTLDNTVHAHREPHLVHDAERVYVTHDGGVTALDAKAGKIVWRSKGPNDRLLLSKDLLLAAQCGLSDDIEQNGRFFSARRVADGKELFRVRLPNHSDFDPYPITEVAGLFLVQSRGWGERKPAAFLITRGGEVWKQFDHLILDGTDADGLRVFLTVDRVLGMAEDKSVRWKIELKDGWALDAGRLLKLPGGDLLAYRYGPISDSGVTLLRLDPCKGKTRFQAQCEPLGVAHSKYRHTATVEMEKGHLKAVSRGSSGTFVELLELNTGKQISRTRGDE
jgi:hypothetical protein